MHMTPLANRRRPRQSGFASSVLIRPMNGTTLHEAAAVDASRSGDWRNAPAVAELGDQTIKIFRSEKEHIIPTSRPGRWETDKKTFLKFACSDGYILLKDVQLEGKKRMNIEDFLRGYRF